MNYTKEKQAISTLLDNFAQVLNSAKTKAIPDFFDQEAVFIPEGMGKFIGIDTLGKTDEGFLKRANFKISYTIKDIIVENNYAFVEAFASTVENRISDLNSVKKSSMDFFVLKNVDDNWKIYRYIFNNVKELEVI
ncbi:nuclear transport factor 2 family protein [Flavobacterium sp. ACN6]|uniref:nuclear transport factor 2 family protein n=1 Tax=Flavobacterium sp. ACN6 TaxID=1920426 RepID=UPI000BB31643|nr:nuclear transport factor 2 family protein [Flavobacterium sp. ACN6]PBJ10145.1 hypothetical protein BSF42_32140 [Flavobacterium sp. ACN6]